MNTLTLRVIEQTTARPIAGVEVRLPHLEPPQEYRTDAEGVCRIGLEEPLPQHLGVYVNAAGRVPVRIVWNLGWRSAPLPADYTLALEPATTIGGRVQDEAGEPIEGATVHLIIWSTTRTGEEKVTTDIFDCTAVTDAEGKWHFDQAPSDISSLSFRLEHPGFVEELHFGKPEAPAGQFRSQTAVWVMKRGVPVRGIVIDREGRPLANAELLPGKDRVSSGAKPAFRTGADGRFSFPQMPGTHTHLTIKADGCAPALLEFEVSEAMPPFRIEMEPGHTIRGRIVDQAGAPIPGAVVFADTWRGHRSLEWMTETDGEGRFAWHCAPADEVLYDFLQTGYQDLRRTPLTASEEEQTITLRRPLWLRGAVTDAATGKPIEAFRIILGHVQGARRIQWMRDRAAQFTGGTYERPFSPHSVAGAVWFLRVEADGYRSAVSLIHTSEDSLTTDFHLDAGPPTSGCVHKPDGTAAADASVAVVFGSSAMLLGGVLKPGHGNMSLSAAADGTFSFPPQEPPYAIVAVHDTGCAIATAEEFAAEPLLHLQPWGTLEIIADGAAPDDAPIPFRLRYADLPRDERRMPWVSFQPEPKRGSGNRILFEKLLPGRAALTRSGQAGHHSLNILIEGSKTITLDFDRGIATGEGKAPGAVPVKVMDQSGAPVAGATVTALRFKLKSPPGSSRSLSLSRSPVKSKSPPGSSRGPSLSQSPAPDILTNAHGVAIIGTPLRNIKDKEIEAIYLLVRHPAFCPAHAEVPLAGEALPIVLKRGATVTLTGFFQADGRAAAPIHVQASSPEPGSEVDPNTWTAREDGALVNTQFPPGKKFLRLACFPEAAPAHFSDVVEVNAEAGRPIHLRLALSPGVPFAGELDATVPRPVANGRIDAQVRTGAADSPVRWLASATIEPDGSFLFDSLPGGCIELVALCDGHASQSPPAPGSRPMRTPQIFPRHPGEPRAVVAMEPTATVHLRITDEQGLPLPGARVHFNPNVVWGDRSAGIFGAARVTTGQFLRMDPEAREKRMQDPSFTHPFHADTDENGAATISNLPSGKQHYAVFHQTYKLEPVAEPRHIPGSREIDLRPGETRTISLKMHKIPSDNLP